MAADRTVPCDHSIRRESSWKAESVIGWSAAQHELGGSGCPNCNPMAKFIFFCLNYTWRKVEIQGREKAPTEVRLCFIYCRGETLFYLLHSSQAPWQLEDTKKVRKDENVSSLFLVNCVQPPQQTTGSHKTEFVFDVRQFGVLQRAQLHFSTPILYTEQLKTTSKISHKEKKKKKKQKKN